MMQEDGYKEAAWSRFCGGLLGYINNYYSCFIKTDYEIQLDISMGDVMAELWKAASIDDLSPQLKKVAEQYEKTIKD